MDCEDYQIELVRGLSSAWEIVRSEHSDIRRQGQYDKKAKAVMYLERVVVYMPLETTGKRRKLALPYHGPCRTVEALSNYFWCIWWIDQQRNRFV